MRKRVQDYFAMGVKDVWIFDPETRIAQACTAAHMTEHKSGTLRVPDTQITLSIEQAFATLDT